MHHLKRFYLRSLSISQASSVDIVEYYNLGKNCIDILLFIKNLVKVFIHLVIHTSFINLWERKKNTNWTIVLNIWLAFLFMCWQNICCFQVWGKIRTEKGVIETGVEITLGQRTWPNIFATWSVINFPNLKLCPVIMWTKNWKSFSSFLAFKVFINKVEITKLLTT